MTKLLEIEDLRVQFRGPHGLVKAVDGISYAVDAGETVAVVGESGCGKSMSALAVLGLVPGGQVTGSIRFEGTDLLTLHEDQIRDVRGRAIAMVFQEPMTSLNPVLSIGVQLTESMRRHLGLSQKQATSRAVELLQMVGIAEPERPGLKLQDALQLPSLNVRGLSSAFVGADARTIIPDSATANLDLRLVKETPARRQIALLIAHIRKHGWHVVTEDPDDATRAIPGPLQLAGRLTPRGEASMLLSNKVAMITGAGSGNDPKRLQTVVDAGTSGLRIT